MSFRRRQHFSGPSVFGIGKTQIPACRCFQMGVSKLGQVTGEAFAFWFEGLSALLPTILLHILGQWNADEARNSAEAEESVVSTCRLDSASGPHVNKNL